MYERIEAVISGRVQGVSFRDYVARKAKGLRLMGEVRNERDGTVYVVAEGPRDHLEKLIEHLHTGPLLADVDKVEIEWYPIAYDYKSFSITK